MPHKHPHLVRKIRVDVVGMGLAQAVPQQHIILAAMPFATDPANAVHQSQGREFGDDQILGSFAIELEQVDLVDPYVGKHLPKIRWCDGIDLEPKITVARLERLPDARDVFAHTAVRDRRRKDTPAAFSCNCRVDEREFVFRNVCGVAHQKLKAFWMGLDGHDLCPGLVVMVHHGETTYMGTDVQDGSDLVRSQHIDLLLVLEHRISKLSAGRFDEEIAAVDLVASRKRHNNQPRWLGIDEFKLDGHLLVFEPMASPGSLIALAKMARWTIQAR